MQNAFTCRRNESWKTAHRVFLQWHRLLKALLLHDAESTLIIVLRPLSYWSARQNVTECTFNLMNFNCHNLLTLMFFQTCMTYLVTLYFKVSLLQWKYTFKYWVILINYMYLPYGRLAAIDGVGGDTPVTSLAHSNKNNLVQLGNRHYN